MKKFIFTTISEFLNEQSTANKDAFMDALLDLTDSTLEFDYVRYPKESDKRGYLFGNNDYDLYVINREELPESGPFEALAYDSDVVIGFLRGNKSGSTVSLNMIHIKEDYRRKGIGTDIYEKFLKEGYTIKSDVMITDDTYNIYDRLLSYGYKPIVYDDGRVGLKK